MFSIATSPRRHPTNIGASASRTSGLPRAGSYLGVVLGLYSRKIVSWEIGTEGCAGLC